MLLIYLPRAASAFFMVLSMSGKVVKKLDEQPDPAAGLTLNSIGVLAPV
jgi:hypothetical protein